MKRLLLLLSLITTAEAKAEPWFMRLMPPAEQSELRNEHPFTVGAPLSKPYNMPGQAQYRITDRWLIGGQLSSAENKKEKGYYESYDYTLDQAAAYLEFYPISRSGFHLGLGVEARRGHYKHYLRDNQGAWQDVGQGTFSGVYGGPSWGWTWIWNNGITFGFDVSTRKLFKANMESEHAAIEPAGAEKTASGIMIPETAPGTIMLGYSF